MELITCIIAAHQKDIDDLMQLISERKQIQVLAETDDLKNATQLIDSLEPQLVFLSALSSLNGFDILTKLKKQPTIIFLIENDPSTIQTFEKNKLHYLTKPYKKEALNDKVAYLQKTHQQLSQQMKNLLGKISFND